jgi:hypothetical protein
LLSLALVACSSTDKIQKADSERDSGTELHKQLSLKKQQQQQSYHHHHHHLVPIPHETRQVTTQTHKPLPSFLSKLGTFETPLFAFLTLDGKKKTEQATFFSFSEFTFEKLKDLPGKTKRHFTFLFICSTMSLKKKKKKLV